MTKAAPHIRGFADAAGTQAYVAKHGRALAEGHYSDFLETGLALSSIGIGTFPGAATDAVDAQVADIVARGLREGLNVIDTAAHYRYGRAARAVGEGVRRAHEAGVPRAAMFLLSKGGFLTFHGGPPANLGAWFEREIAGRGFGRREDLAARAHLMTPEYLDHQLDASREAMGVETLDAFLVDQPEVQIPEIGKEALLKRLDRAFVALERAVKDGRLRYYGVSSFHCFRAVTDDALYLSLPSLLFLAERAALEVYGPKSAHHFAVIELPFNAVMPEGFTRFNQVTGQGNEASVLQAALQLKVFAIASHTMFKGHLARQSLDALAQTMPRLTPAQRAIQFNRSTPGLGAALVGLSTPSHLEDVLAVGRVGLLPREVYVGMYQRVG